MSFNSTHKSVGISALLASCVMLGSPVKSWSISADSLKENTWFEKKPAFKFLPGLNGRYQDRGWCTLRYQSKNKSMIFYEGYTRTRDCIYANSLYELDPVRDTVHMRSISNWNCEEHTVGPALPANATNPTPMDRHTYAQFAYVPSNNKLYMAHGAMGNNNHQHDLWAYSFDNGKWENLGAAPGGTANWECTCALNFIYSPVTEEIFFFGSQRGVYAYKIASNTWRTMASPKNATTKDIGGHGLYDPKRNVFAFYGNNWTSDDAGSTTFLIYDPVANAWSEKAPTATWPPAKSYASLEYNSKHDVYMLHGGWTQNDTWLWYPSAGVWRQLTTPNKPAAISNRGTYTAYNPDQDALVTYSQGTMWYLKVVPNHGVSPVIRDNRGGAAPAPRLLMGRNLDVLLEGGQGAGLIFRDLRNRRIEGSALAHPGRPAQGMYVLEPRSGKGARNRALMIK